MVWATCHMREGALFFDLPEWEQKMFRQVGVFGHFSRYSVIFLVHTLPSLLYKHETAWKSCSTASCPTCRHQFLNICLLDWPRSLLPWFLSKNSMAHHSFCCAPISMKLGFWNQGTPGYILTTKNFQSAQFEKLTPCN